MAGRQLRIYLHPDDRHEVESFVANRLGAVLLAPRSPTASLVRSSVIEGSSAMVCPVSRVDDLRPRYIESRHEWVLTAGRDPVIEWWYSKLDGDNLYPGRLYYVAARGGDEFGSSTANRDLISTAEALVKWMKKFAMRCDVAWGREYVGPRARLLLDAGELSLRQNPPGSRI